jgi:site-specific DNA recombinase
VRKLVDSREVRTVELDPERAPLVRWAFETYASGNWSLRQIAHELEIRGLTQRPTAKRPARSLPKSKLAATLRNPYYVGVVTWRGLQFEGKHPAIVTPEVFARVQAVLEAHRLSGERSYRRKHYLAGTLYCARCESKLIYSVSTGSRGESYAYWCCIGRHTYRNGCELPYLPDDLVEAAVIAQWQHERFAETDAAVIRDNLLADLADYTTAAHETGDRLDRRIASIQHERLKWAEKAMAGTVPDDIARDKQQHLARQLAAAETQRAQLSLATDQHEAAIRAATALLPTCGEAYQRGTDTLRRDYNQAWFDQLYLDDEGGQPRVARAVRSDLFDALKTAEVGDEPVETISSAVFAGISVVREASQNRRHGHIPVVFSHVAGSKVPCLVEVRHLRYRTVSGRLSTPGFCAGRRPCSPPGSPRPRCCSDQARRRRPEAKTASAITARASSTQTARSSACRR